MAAKMQQAVADANTCAWAVDTMATPRRNRGGGSPGAGAQISGQKSRWGEFSMKEVWKYNANK